MPPSLILALPSSFLNCILSGGIINCKQGKVCQVNDTDHVVVIAGWGVDAATGTKYWVGRNSYGTQVSKCTDY